MKKGIHPQLNTDVTVTCACGSTFVTSSTLTSITVDICSNCHPFYTGTQNLVDTEGRLDKFNKRLKAIQIKKENVKKPRSRKASANEQKLQLTLKEMMDQTRSTN